MPVPLGKVTSADRGTRRVIRLRGTDALRSRLDAVAADGFRRLAEEWQDAALAAGKSMVPRASGATAGSLRKMMPKYLARRKSISVQIGGSHVAYFIDAGVRAHGAKRARVMRFEGGEGTIFAKRVRGYRRRPFRARMARAGMSGAHGAQAIIDAWNGGA